MDLELPPPQVLIPSSRDPEPDFRLEAFAHAVAFGVPVAVALSQAGYEKPSTSLGYLLLRDPRAIAIIDADRIWLREKLQASREAMAAQFDHDREFAYAQENPSAAVSASMGKARILGFMDVGSSQRAPSKITIEWGGESTETIHERAILVEEHPEEDV